MTPEEKLARIADLCDAALRLRPSENMGVLDASAVRAVLDAPSVPAARAGGIDRDALTAEVVEILHEVARDAVDRYEVPMSYPPIDFNARATDVLALVQPALDVAAPVWAFTPEGHDDEYEYVVTTDCYGQYPNTFRRTPKRVVPVGEWESIPNLPPEEQRRSVYPGEGVRS